MTLDEAREEMLDKICISHVVNRCSQHGHNTAASCAQVAVVPTRISYPLYRIYKLGVDVEKIAQGLGYAVETVKEWLELSDDNMWGALNVN